MSRRERLRVAAPLLNAVEACRTHILQPLCLRNGFYTCAYTCSRRQKYEVENKNFHGGTTKHELEHKKCHGGSDNKARRGAQKVSRRERQQSTKWSRTSVTEGATTKHELEHKKCHGGSDNKAEVEHKKCHGGSGNKARSGAQKVSRRE